VIVATPLGLLALLAIPAIIAIHLFRRRFPVRRVAGLFLWQLARQVPTGGGVPVRLPITTSLILECLAALALALILAGARLSPAAVTEHLVVLLDDSASMAAVDGRGESARDRAVRRVLAEIDRLGSNGRVTLIQSGERPSVLAGPASLALEARPALESWHPEAGHHSFALGLRLARELAGRTGTLMVVSDAPPAVAGEGGVEGAIEGVLWASVGTPLANVGITGADRMLTPDEGRGAIALTLGNFSDSPARRRVRVLAGDVEVLAREVDAPPGTSSITLPLPAGLPAVRVELPVDALARDNGVTLVEPRPQIVGVENRLTEGRGRQALERALGALSGVTSSESAHLVFTEAGELDRVTSSGAWRVGFGRGPAEWLTAGDTEDFIGPFVLEKRHPLLSGVTFGGVVWAGAAAVDARAVRPLASAGDRLLIGVHTAGALPDPAILVNLDLDRTNLIRAPDWPILISNLVEMRRQELPGPERWNYRAGEWIRVRLGRDPTGPLRFRCGALERELPAGRVLEFTAPAPCGLLQILEGDDVRFALGVNFLDETEGDLREKGSAEIGGLDAAALGLRTESGPASDPLFWLLLAIGSAAILTNWCLQGDGRRFA
jgi:hypothetical protein